MALAFEFDFQVAKAALLYLASQRLPDFDKNRALKLLFLADREHLVRFGRPITGDDYSALPFGPAPNRLLAFLNSLEKVILEGADPDCDEVAELARCLDVTEIAHPIYTPKVEADLDFLSKTDRIVLDSVAANQGHSGFDELVKLTQGMKAYAIAWRPQSLARKFPMPFESFFADFPEKADILEELEADQALTQSLVRAAQAQKVMSA